MNLDFVNFFHPGLWIKIITLIVIAFYAVFTFVVFVQIRVMSQILHLPHGETLYKMIAIIHIVLAISLFFGALVIL